MTTGLLTLYPSVSPSCLQPALCPHCPLREEEGSPSCPPTIERSHDTVALALWEVHIPKGQGMLETLLGSASSRLEG